MGLDIGCQTSLQQLVLRRGRSQNSVSRAIQWREGQQHSNTGVLVHVC